jgi:eukaryotic-like serine/threonine-protein kinase
VDLAERLQAALASTYVVEGEIGRGGMAAVFRAYDVKHARPVALKVLHGTVALALGPDRFRQEITLAANLHHPHILPVYDSGETSDALLWFTMPLVVGETLRQRLLRDHQLPLPDVIQIAGEIADAIDYAHRRGVVHGDIKPENILLADGHALLGDFGIARPMAARHDAGAAVGLVGTPAYMSPEQARGYRLDASSDIYSLGAVVFEMLSGRPPVAAKTPDEALDVMSHHGIASVRSARSDVSSAADAAVRRAISPVPADRFLAATAFVAALEGDARRDRRSSWLVAVPVAACVVVAVLAVLMRRAGSLSTTSVPVVAVLPFENAGDTSQAYVADGISDDIRGKLATLRDIQVIAGASTREYRSTTEEPADIARDLGARYLVTGRVQWEQLPSGTRRLRVAPELIEIVPGRPPITQWEQSFDADLTDVFHLETEVATRVAQTLRVALASQERARLARQPTANVDAWAAYQRGVAFNYRGTNTLWQQRAAAELERATAVDPSFVAAWAAASRTHAVAFLAKVPGDPADSAAARREAARALALAPDMPDGYLAEGTFDQFVRQDFTASMRAYDAGLRTAPNDASLLGQLAFTEMRAGRWADVLVHFAEARRLNPRSVSLTINLGMAYLYLRRYAEARAVLDGAQALAPRSLARIQYRTEAALGAGDTADAHAVLHAALSVVDTSALVGYIGLADDLVWALDAPLRQRLLALSPKDFDDSRSDWAMVLAEGFMFRGDSARGRAYADTAERVYATLLRTHSDDPQLHALNGVALAYMGHRNEAVREAERAVSLDPIEQDATLGAYLLQQLARTYTAVGDSARAVDVLDRLHRAPGLISPGWLRVDPNFARLRGDPGFQRLAGSQ